MMVHVEHALNLMRNVQVAMKMRSALLAKGIISLLLMAIVVSLTAP